MSETEAPPAAEEPERTYTGWKVTLKTGASVTVFPEIASGGAGFRFVNPEGVELKFSLSEEACDALLRLLKDREERRRYQEVIWTCVVGPDGTKVTE